MAEACGLTVSTIQNIWKAHGLAPYRWRKAAINRFVAQHNQSPNLFVWRADPDAPWSSASAPTRFGSWCAPRWLSPPSSTA